LRVRRPCVYERERARARASERESVCVSGDHSCVRPQSNLGTQLLRVDTRETGHAIFGTYKGPKYVPCSAKCCRGRARERQGM
jgi:hypothetical protein